MQVFKNSTVFLGCLFCADHGFCISWNLRTQPLDLILQDVGSLYCDEICESIAKKEISSAALVLDESMDSLFYDANDDILRPTTVQGVISGTKCSNMMNIARGLNIFLFNKNCQRQIAKGVQWSENPTLSSFQKELPCPLQGWKLSQPLRC